MSKVADRSDEEGVISGFSTVSDDFHKSSFSGRAGPKTGRVYKQNVTSLERVFWFVSGFFAFLKIVVQRENE